MHVSKVLATILLAYLSFGVQQECLAEQKLPFWGSDGYYASRTPSVEGFKFCSEANVKKEHETGKPHCDGYLSKKDFNRFVDNLRYTLSSRCSDCYTKQCVKQTARLNSVYWRRLYPHAMKSQTSGLALRSLISGLRSGSFLAYHCRGKYGVYEERIINNHGMVVYEAWPI